MSITEELDHKRVQAAYLRKLLKCVNEEIAELETPFDSYSELKLAHASGKRIAVINRRYREEWNICDDPKWYAFCDYKIVEDDEVVEKEFYFSKGKISVEVVE